MKHFKAALAALTMLCGIAAMPAHAQSLEDQAAAAAPAPTQVVKDQPVAASSTTEVSYVQAPVQTETSITPRVSFQTTGSRDDWRLYVDANVRAYHFDRAEAHANHYLEANYGGGFEITNDVLGATFGYYHNSIHRGSWYILGRYTPFQFDLTSKDRVNVGVLAGVLSGYLKTSEVFEGYGFDRTPGQPTTIVPVYGTQSKPRGFMPAAGFLVSYEHNHQWGVNLIFVPPVRSEGVSPFMGVQLRYALPVGLGF